MVSLDTPKRAKTESDEDNQMNEFEIIRSPKLFKEILKEQPLTNDTNNTSKLMKLDDDTQSEKKEKVDMATADETCATGSTLPAEEYTAEKKASFNAAKLGKKARKHLKGWLKKNSAVVDGKFWVLQRLEHSLIKKMNISINGCKTLSAFFKKVLKHERYEISLLEDIPEIHPTYGTTDMADLAEKPSKGDKGDKSHYASALPLFFSAIAEVDNQQREMLNKRMGLLNFLSLSASYLLPKIK